MTLDVGWATCAGQSGQRDKSGERSKSVEWELGEGVDRWGGETEGGRRERMRDRERQGTCRQRFVQAPFVVEREPTHARPVGGRRIVLQHPGREGVWHGERPKHRSTQTRVRATTTANITSAAFVERRRVAEVGPGCMVLRGYWRVGALCAGWLQRRMTDRAEAPARTCWERAAPSGCCSHLQRSLAGVARRTWCRPGTAASHSVHSLWV